MKKLRALNLFFAFTLLIALWPWQEAEAQLSCRGLYHQTVQPVAKVIFTKKPAEIIPGVHQAPFKRSEQVRRLMLWEQTSNQKRWEKPRGAIKIDLVSISKDEVITRAGEGASEKLLAAFINGKKVNWFRHPLNDSDKVPFRQEERSGFLIGHYSASRSIFVNVNGDLYSFKLGTNRPHPKAVAQPEKAGLLNDSDISMRRSHHIRTFDQSVAMDKDFHILTEVFSMATLENGFSVRDLRPLQDGNYYLPAFSIPYAGATIARKLNFDFNQLWGQNYGVSLGKAKALLVLRYGLQMKTPNAQNWLLQLNPEGIPTGKIYMRDVADSNYVDFIAKHIAPEQMQADRDSNYTIMTNLKPYWENSAWQMDEGNVPKATLDGWGQQHDHAYVETFRKTLGIDKELDSINELENYLRSDEGQEMLKQYGEGLRHRRERSANKAA